MTKILKKMLVLSFLLFTVFILGCDETINTNSYELKIGTSGKTEYYIGEEFDLQGFELEIICDGKVEKNISLTKEMLNGVNKFESSGKQTINIVYLYNETELKCSLEVNVKQDNIKGIEVKKEGKKDYFIGEEFDIQNYTFEITYESGVKEEINGTKEMFSPIIFTEAKEYDIEINYTKDDISLKTNIKVNVNKAIVESINLKTSGKTEYNIGEAFDPSNYTFELKYNNGETQEVKGAEVTISLSTFETAGEQELLIKYTKDGIEVETKIKVTVNKKQPISLNVKQMGETIYTINVNLDLSGYVFEVEYNDGTKQEVAITLDNVNKYVFEENGEDEPVIETIIVKYTIEGIELTTSFEISVLAEWNYETYIGEKEAKVVVSKIIEDVTKALPLETQTNITLPSTSQYGYGYIIVYSSNNPDVLSGSGTVNPVEEDVVVTLTVIIKNDYYPTTQSFDVLVKGLGPVKLRPWVATEKHVFAYFYEGTSATMKEEDAKRIDVINYCFARVSNGVVDVSGLNHLTENLKLRRSTGVRIVLSVGGGGSGSLGFSAACESAEARKIFIDSMIEVIKKYQFDGIDLDWEYPAWVGLSDAKPADKNNFTLLCKELKAAMNEYKEGLLLTSAVIGGLDIGRFYDAVELNKYLDYAHLMTYDLNSDGVCTHHCNTYDGRAYSAEGAVETYHKAGFDYEKLVIGVAFYGKISKLATPTTASSAVYNKPIAKNADGKYETSTITYTRIYDNYLFNSKFVKIYDENNGAYYLTDGEYFITYDDPKAIELKCQLVKLYNLQGIMFWDYGSDTTGNLLRSVVTGIDSINIGRS